MDIAAVCVFGPGLKVGEQDLFRDDETSVGWELCGGSKSEPFPWF